jgi:hypothetical protein
MANLANIIPAIFTGPNGQRLTPEQIAERQQLAQSLMAQATDTSPNAGGVASILAKGVQGFAAGRSRNQADAAAGANAKASTANVASLLGLLGGGSAAPVGQGATVANPMIAPVKSVAAGGPVIAEGEIADYIRQSASARGIDPDIALRVAMSEGGVKDPTRQSEVVKNGVREASYGPFQLYMGGGLGNKALEAGIDPRDPNQWRQGVDFALDQAATGGWSPWYGAAKVGVGNRAGLDNARAIGFSKQVAQPAAAAIEKAAPSSGYVDPMVKVVSNMQQPTAQQASMVNASPMQQAPMQTAQAAPAINPAIIEALSSPYASEQERSVAGLLLNQTMGQQQAAQAKVLKQQERQQEIARRQQIAQQSGIDPAYAQDDELWKGATGQIFAAPSTSTVNNTVIDNRTGKPIYQGEPQRQPLMNLGDGTVYDPNAPQDQRFIQAPNGGNKVPDSVRALEIRAERAGLKAGTPEYNQFMISGGSGGTSLSVGPDGTVQYSQGGAGGKNLTEAQGKDAFFSARMTSAMPTLDKYEQSLMSLPEAAAGAVPGGRFLQSEEYQLAKDAGDDFVATYLRKDSGAALTKEERSEYGNMLLPQPGDKPAIIEAKRIRRQVAAKAIQLGLPQSAVDNMVKSVGDVKGAVQAVPTTSENPMPNQQTATGWKDLGNGVKIRPKGSN